MIVIGSKGFAKEILEVLVSPKYSYNEHTLFFFDDLNYDAPDLLYGQFKVLKSIEEVKVVFRDVSNEFCLGLGSPKLRQQLADKFSMIGGCLKTIISENSLIGSYGIQIGIGSTIVGNAVMSSDITIGKGCLIYMNTSITHDVVLGDFVQVSPGVIIAGRSIINDYTFLGSGCTILPDIVIGSNCVIGAGSIVTKNVPNNSTLIGNPGRLINIK